MIKKPNHSLLALCFGLALTIGIAPIKAGALHWVSMAWVSLCCIALAVVLGFKFSSTSKPRVKPLKEALKLYSSAYLFLAFQIWTVLQYFAVAPDKTASLNQSIIGLGMACLLSIWYYAVRHPSALRMLYISLIIFSVVQAVYGLWIFLSGTNLLLWMPKLYYLDRPTGFFVNANHFAAYIVISIILCLSSIISTRPRSSSRSLLIRSFDQLYSPNSAVLCLLLITLLASKSIGAMVSLGLVLFVLALKMSWRSKNFKGLLFGATVITGLFFFFALSVDYSSIESQIANLSHTVSRRLALGDAAFAMLKEHWFLGIGGGAFYSQFSPYRTLEIGNSYYNYAHNDLLQFWIEYGLIGISLLILFVSKVLRDNIQVLSKKPSGMHATFARASIYTTIAVAVHSLVDFPLHIPGFSVCYIILISINSLCLINWSQSRGSPNSD